EQMIFANISLGLNVEIDPTTTINNVVIKDYAKIAKYCSVFGSKEFPLIIGEHSYIGMNTILNGYSAPLTIGACVSIAQNVNIMTDSGPNASERLQRVFPIKTGIVEIGDHSWIGASVVIMPDVRLGKYCIVAANSFVTKSFSDYSVIGGSPAQKIRTLSSDEITMISYD
ncbi:MAG: acyltransferase, partial [Odoribacter sp.]